MLRAVTLLTVALVAAIAVASASAKDRQIAGYCSESGDVCIQIQVSGGVLFLRINTAADYFSTYRLCVRGPKSRVCKSFAMRSPAKAGDQPYSKVAWRRNFPYQGPGLYRVTWQYSAKALSFRLPLT